MKRKVKLNDLPAVKLPVGKGSTLFLDGGLISNGHFLISSDWFNSLEGNPKLAELFSAFRESEIRDVTAKVTNEYFPQAPKPLATILSDVKLKFYKPVDLNKLEPVKGWNPPIFNPDGDDKRDWSVGIQAYSFEVKSSPIPIEISADYCGLLAVDPETKVLAKRYDKPIAILKNGVAVAVIMPIRGLTAKQYEEKLNAKSK